MQVDLILEKWKQYEMYHDVLSDREYIVEVLGIDMPVNESGYMAYTPLLRKQIIEEHLLMEGWWDSFKQNIKSYPETFQMLYVATTDSAKVITFTKAIKRKSLKVKDTIMKFVNWVLEKTQNSSNAILQKLNGWADSLKDKIQKALNWIDGITKPWMKALGFAALSVGLNYVWSKIANYASEMMGCGDEEGEEEESDLFDTEEAGSAKDVATDAAIGCILKYAKKFLGDKIVKAGQDAMKKVADAGAGIMSGGASTFWKFLVAIGKGVKFVVSTLAPALQFFKNRGGFSNVQEELATEGGLEYG